MAKNELSSLQLVAIGLVAALVVLMAIPMLDSGRGKSSQISEED